MNPDSNVLTIDPVASLNAGVNTYPVASKVSKNVFGKVTGTKIKLTDKDEWLTSTYYYDDKGHLFQVLGTNAKSATDVETYQYDYQGHVICTYTTIKNPVSTNPTIALQQRMDFNELGKPQSSYVTLYNGNETTTRQTHLYEYDDLGRLKKDNLGNLESLNYTYDFLGQMKGINTDFLGNADADHYFGMELAYADGFSNSSKSGGISGVKWRRKGDPDVCHAYGYAFDNAGRIKQADYSMEENQSWSNGNADFSLQVPLYDANGNIKRLIQNGMATGGSKTTIDDLTYNNEDYEYSNRLTGVTDAVGDQHLGDFKNYDNRISKEDYSYDKSGNLTGDKNRGVTIVNNYLVGKPDKIFQVSQPQNVVSFTYT